VPSNTQSHLAKGQHSAGSGGSILAGARHSPRPLRIAIAGMGAIGTAVARAIVQGAIPGATLAAVSARDEQKCRATVDAHGSRAPVLPVAEL